MFHLEYLFLFWIIVTVKISINTIVENLQKSRKKKKQKSDISETRSLSRSFLRIDLLLILTDLCSPPDSLFVSNVKNGLKVWSKSARLQRMPDIAF